MAQLFDQIRQAVDAERFIVSNHADERLRERMIELWQLISGLNDARLLTERPMDVPNPSVEVDQTLADGTDVKVVRSLGVSRGVAILVTVHFYDR